MEMIDAIEILLGEAKTDLQYDSTRRGHVVEYLKFKHRQQSGRQHFIFRLEDGIYRIGYASLPRVFYPHKMPDGIAILHKAITSSPFPLEPSIDLSPNAVANQVCRARKWLIKHLPAMEEPLKQVHVNGGGVWYDKSESNCVIET